MSHRDYTRTKSLYRESEGRLLYSMSPFLRQVESNGPEAVSNAVSGKRTLTPHARPQIKCASARVFARARTFDLRARMRCERARTWARQRNPRRPASALSGGLNRTAHLPSFSIATLSVERDRAKRNFRRGSSSSRNPISRFLPKGGNYCTHPHWPSHDMEPS